MRLLGNGTSTSFPYTFYVIDADHVYVYIDGVLKTTGVTVNNVGNITGGTVVLSPAPALAAKVVIERVVPYTQ